MLYRYLLALRADEPTNILLRKLAAAKLQHLAVLRLAERSRHGLREVLLSEGLSQGWLLRVESRAMIGI